MKDIPVFTTEHGVASLILKEIPYRKEAYIRLQDTMSPKELVEECYDFCRMCGAEFVYAAGNEYLEAFELHTAIIEMSVAVDANQAATDYLWPVTNETVGKWRSTLNQKMSGVDNAGTLESRDENRILQSGGAYFVHRDEKILGIGWLNDGTLESIASVEPGAGHRVLHTMLSLCPGENVKLQVASTNQRAISLYEKNGFIKVRELSRWYTVKKEKL